MYSLVIGVWLSLVEYVVWDHGAGGSNPSTPIFLWDIDLVNKCDVLFSCPKTPAFSICAFFTLIPSVLPKFLTTIKVLRPTKKRPQRFSVAASCDLLFSASTPSGNPHRRRDSHAPHNALPTGNLFQCRYAPARQYCGPHIKAGRGPLRFPLPHTVRI